MIQIWQVKLFFVCDITLKAMFAQAEGGRSSDIHGAPQQHLFTSSDNQALQVP